MKAREVIIKLQVVAALWAACVCTGCSRQGERGHVTGTLQTHGGTPLPGANVVATSGETGKSAHGTTDQAGHFELGMAAKGDGIPLGNYNIGIAEDRGDPDNRRPPTIATKYRDPATSGIKLTVSAGESKELNLKLDPP